ncbi:MAG: MlaE family lipid ABC transporter permease subunit [Alphaproteobacteria bacterium]|nr:MlaE family lipid ABC transporter permease subunit [Alphaproteobacteria bacterium]
MATDALMIDDTGGELRLTLAGRWTLDAVMAADSRLRALSTHPAGRVIVDAHGLTGIDSAGAWALRRTLNAFEVRGIEARLEGLSETYRPILEKAYLPDPAAEIGPPEVNPLIAVLERAGRETLNGLQVARNLLGFLGLVLTWLARAIVQPGRIRFTAVIAQIERTGVNALPIVGLLCFLVGVVLAYMGALQLERFGAKQLTVNLVGVSVLREIGILLTAIIVAGRSGSAFAAQIGTMKVNQEVDALETLGLSAIEVLVLPRVIALMIALPALAVFGDLMGLMGGAVVAIFLLDMSSAQFMTQLVGAVSIWDFSTGLIKAPIFALVIALVGCYDGLNVTGSAESVGQQTTRAVVESIFIVIVLDAAFAIAYAELGI